MVAVVVVRCSFKAASLCSGCICMYIYMSVAKTLLVIHVVACLHVHFFLLDFCVQ